MPNTPASSSTLDKVGDFKPRSSELIYVLLDAKLKSSWLSPRSLRVVLRAAGKLFAGRLVLFMHRD